MAMEIPALGRPFSLGMLYDCHDDNLIPGITFWKRETLEKNVRITSQNNTSFEVLASDRVSDKSSALNIKASLKASFLCGLIQVGGSGHFLRDLKASRTQARVTLKYYRSTRFEQLSMDHLSTENLSYHNVFDKGAATHVVTGILYGAQAFFIFDQDISPLDNTLNVQGSIESMIKRIPSVLEMPKLTDKEKEIISKFNCTFHGDFALERNPVNYEDAIKIYTSLPKLLGEKGEKAVPLKVWLHPLKTLENNTDLLVREISDNLIYMAEEIIQQMADVNMQCNDLMRHPVAVTFPDIKRKIERFRDQCIQFTLMFQKQLAKALPCIRGGKLDEDKLLDIFRRKEQSPFGNLEMTEFLSRKQQEMDVINSYLKALPNITVLPTENKVKQVVIDQEIEYTMCFNFASLNAVEQYLLELNDWVQSNKRTSGDIYEEKKVAQWYNDKGLFKKAGQYVKEFEAFANFNTSHKLTQFFVSAVVDESHPGISVYLYKGGDLLNREFEPPSKPNLPLITKKTHNTIELMLRPADFGKESIEGYKVEYKLNEMNNWFSINTEHKVEKITISGLKANSCYQFRYSAVCKPGFSVVSEVSEAEKTLPTSPPETQQITAEPKSLIVFWHVPLIVGDGAKINEYRVEYKEENASTWLEKRTGQNTNSCVIEGLETKTLYIVRVRAVCGDAGESDPSEEIQVWTPAEGTVKGIVILHFNFILFCRH